MFFIVFRFSFSRYQRFKNTGEKEDKKILVLILSKAASQIFQNARKKKFKYKKLLSVPNETLIEINSMYMHAIVSCKAYSKQDQLTSYISIQSSHFQCQNAT